jgi:hypothetical protein
VTPNEVRAQLIDALQLDLIGPRSGHAPHARYAEEVLPIAPSKWYLTGFLVPYEAPASQREDDDSAETLDELGRKIEADDDSAPEAASARKVFFPSSLGISVLVSADTMQFEVKLAWADYEPVAKPGEANADRSELGSEHPPEERAGRGLWRRVPRHAEHTVALADGTQTLRGLPGLDLLALVISVRAVGEHGLLRATTHSSGTKRPRRFARRSKIASTGCWTRGSRSRRKRATCSINARSA